MTIFDKIADYKTNRINKKISNKQKFIGKDNILFNMKMVTYTTSLILSLSFIFALIYGPLQLVGQVMYYKSSNDNVTQSIVGYCKYQKTDEDKIYCVNRFVLDNWNYNVTTNVLTPDELIKNKGGDCKSWSNLYMTTLKQMGVKVRQDFHSVSKHTFVIADTDKGYCVIDQRSVNCGSLTDKPTCDDVKGNCVSFN